MPDIQAIKVMIKAVLTANLAIIMGNPLPVNVSKDLLMQLTIVEATWKLIVAILRRNQTCVTQILAHHHPPLHMRPTEWLDTLIVVIDPPDIPYINYVNIEHIGVKNNNICRGFSAIGSMHILLI